MTSDQLRVFVSGSMGELAEEREAVIERLRRLGMEVLSMEAFAASSKSPAQLVHEQLARADLVVSILGRTVGTYTLDELDEARRRRVPLLLFVKDDAERSPELSSYLVESGRIYRTFTTPDDLVAEVMMAVARFDRDTSVPEQGRRRDVQPSPDDHGLRATEAPESLRFTSTGEPIESWDEVMDLARDQGKARNWLFRGQPDSRWGLATALERTAMKFSVPWSQVNQLEDDLLVSFQRQLGNFQADVPAEDSRIEWLALMQHHGAPTRLLDWSHSFYVALLFALEHAEIGTPCAIWALDAEWCRHIATRSLHNDETNALASDPTLRKPATVESVLFRVEPIPLVIPINPFRLNERLVLQQGIFVAPADVGRTFQENLDQCARQQDGVLKLEKTEIVCTPQLLKDAVRELHRMNVNRATLFPGLDGFSAHLGNMAVDRDLIGMDITPPSST